MTLKEKIDFYLSQFEFKEVKRDGQEPKTITVFKEQSADDKNENGRKPIDENLRQSVYAAHGDRLPDDWIFDKYMSILDALNSGYTINTIDDAEEHRSEIVDGLVDVYTADLTAWLASNINNVQYMTAAAEEYGKESDGFKILAMAQFKAIDEIYQEVINLLNK
mgnify:CR=1 FL=1